MQTDPTIEFSRILTFDQIKASGSSYHIQAKEEECHLLAKRFNLVAVKYLKADFFLTHAEEPRCYHIKGEVEGDVVQSCVSTLKDVPAHVHAFFDIVLKPSQGEGKEEEYMIDLEDATDIEYYTQENIDLGETAAQYLYLNLDPFPHAPDAPKFFKDTTEKQVNPLAQALKGLKKDK